MSESYIESVRSAQSGISTDMRIVYNKGDCNRGVPKYLDATLTSFQKPFILIYTACSSTSSAYSTIFLFPDMTYTYKAAIHFNVYGNQGDGGCVAACYVDVNGNFYYTTGNADSSIFDGTYFCSINDYPYFHTQISGSSSPLGNNIVIMTLPPA